MPPDYLQPHPDTGVRLLDGSRWLVYWVSECAGHQWPALCSQVRIVGVHSGQSSWVCMPVACARVAIGGLAAVPGSVLVDDEVWLPLDRGSCDEQ